MVRWIGEAYDAMAAETRQEAARARQRLEDGGGAGTLGSKGGGARVDAKQTFDVMGRLMPPATRRQRNNAADMYVYLGNPSGGTQKAEAQREGPRGAQRLTRGAGRDRDGRAHRRRVDGAKRGRRRSAQRGAGARHDVQIGPDPRRRDGRGGGRGGAGRGAGRDAREASRAPGQGSRVRGGDAARTRRGGQVGEAQNAQNASAEAPGRQKRGRPVDAADSMSPRDRGGAPPAADLRLESGDSARRGGAGGDADVAPGQKRRLAEEPAAPARAGGALDGPSGDARLQCAGLRDGAVAVRGGPPSRPRSRCTGACPQPCGRSKITGAAPNSGRGIIRKLGNFGLPGADIGLRPRRSSGRRGARHASPRPTVLARPRGLGASTGGGRRGRRRPAA